MASATGWIATGTAIQLAGLALMAGGMLAIGAFAAPVMFKGLSRPEAGDLLTLIFRRYDSVIVTSLGLVLIGELVRVFPGQLTWMSSGPVAWLRTALLVVLLAAGLYTTMVLNPQIERMHAAGIHPGGSPEGLQFSRVHKTSENLYKLEMALSLLLILLTPYTLPLGPRGHG
ncbi:MAG: DUF4149 domain-containing protein [Candidatus Melainabacteria bacterium]